MTCNLFLPKAPTREDRMRAWIAQHVKPTDTARKGVQQTGKKVG